MNTIVTMQQTSRKARMPITMPTATLTGPVASSFSCWLIIGVSTFYSFAKFDVFFGLVSFWAEVTFVAEIDEPFVVAFPCSVIVAFILSVYEVWFWDAIAEAVELVLISLISFGIGSVITGSAVFFYIQIFILNVPLNMLFPTPTT